LVNVHCQHLSVEEAAMARKTQRSNSRMAEKTIVNAKTWKAASVVWTVLLLMLFVAASALAQTYEVVHNFTGGADGEQPLAGLSIDAAGNLYGTTHNGATSPNCFACGVVFRVSPKGSGWVFSTLHNFQGGSNDGANPSAKVIFGPDGNLYGSTNYGGSFSLGTVFRLQRPARACVSANCPWNVSVLYSFYNTFGANDIVFDQAGNIYGTTSQGGINFRGTVYELTPSNGSWTATILTQFGNNLGSPYSGVVVDQAGNVYGTADVPQYGIAYELTASGHQLQVLHQFDYQKDGSAPDSDLISDSAGNLYGLALGGGPNGGGTVFELSPSSGGWTFNVLVGLHGGQCNGTFLGSSNLTMDAAGNLYGTTYCSGAYGWGSVFKLTPSSHGWSYTSLHDFCADGYPCSDGCLPSSNVVMDTKGNLFGTASGCGAYSRGEYGSGVIWEITP
jgi:uncharacterized repeat protein (TIGR03803 family)